MRTQRSRDPNPRGSAVESQTLGVDLKQDVPGMCRRRMVLGFLVGLQAAPIQRLAISFGMITFLLAWNSLAWNSAAWAQSPSEPRREGAQAPQESLVDRQARLKNNFTRLEQKLLDLYEFELTENPERSELLKDAFQLSQERRIALQLESVVERLESKEFKSALDGQRAALIELQALLQLLQNEDQSERLQEEQKRIKAYLVEVERLLRIQQGLRGQAEGGVDPQRLTDSQGKTADRAEKLAQELRDNEGADQPFEDSEVTQEATSDAEPGQAPTEVPQPDAQDQNKQPGGDENLKPGQSADQPPQPSPPSSGQGSGAPPEGDSKDPVRERVEAAQKRMREAQQRLQEAKRDQSVKEMRAAETELAKAKEELEQILRQLREKEIERTLGMLETRFREMLKQEQEILSRTERLNQIEMAQRGAEFHIEAGKLSAIQMNVALEADRLLMILLEEGSAIAFPETVMQVRDDMEEVAGRLRNSKIEPLTLALEEDIVQGLQDILDALVAAQEENKKNQEEPKPEPGPRGTPPGQPGEAPLVNQIEELKLIRNLQERIFERHQRYSKLIDEPDDPIGYTNNPEIQRALDQLSERQNQLHKITRDVIEKQQ